MKGRRVVIAGLGGIGEAVARRALHHGAAVHVIDLDGERAGVVASTLGVTHTAADLTSLSDCEIAFDEANAALGGLDGLVCTAGGSGRRWGDGPVGSLAMEAIEQTLRLNALPPLLTLNAFVSRVAEAPGQRSAVLVGSVLAQHPHADFDTHVYAFAKAGIEGLARAAAARYAADRIQVNVVAPGLTRTPMSRRAQGDSTVRARAVQLQPLTADGFVAPAEVARACVWLLESREVTGQVVHIDGGWSTC